MKSHLKRTALFSATCLSTIALSATPVLAQDATGDETEAPRDAIVVTGSRLSQDRNFTSPEPLTVINRDQMVEQGFNSLSDVLQSNAVTQGGSQINNYYGGFVVNGGTGVNTVGLRGLGPSRTLVLLNGKRLAPAGTRGSVGSVDLNTIPTSIVKSVEVLKAGASSVYGSDAVGGVVNIITDDSLIGPKLEMQINVPQMGAGVDQRISGAYGIGGDNWHVVASVDWRKRKEVTLGDVDFTKCPIGGYLSGEGTAFGSGDYVDPKTGEPACYTLDNGGLTINTIGVPTRSGTDRVTGETGRFNRFVPDASVTGGNTPGYAGVSYYTRDTFTKDMLKESLVTPTENLNVFLQGSVDLNALGDAELYGEFLYSNRKSSGSGYRQLALDYATGSELIPEQFRNGVFLSPNEISNGNYVALRSFIGYGIMKSEQDVDFFRAAGGLRGETGLSDWRYDVYGSYSWSNAKYGQETFLTDRIAQSLDVVANGDGTFNCVDTSNGCVAAPAVNADSVGGNLSQAYRDFITDTVWGTTKTAEYIASLYVDGSLFELPGGTAKAGFGAEYRHSKLDDQPSADSINGNMYNLTTSAPTYGTDEVWEVFGEVALPVLADMPFAYSLNINASGRYTHYRSYGGEWTYKAGADYAPVRGVTFRGSYGTSYRAPSLFEQYLGSTSGFLSSSYDPCDSYGESNNVILQQNCASIGLNPDFTQTSSIQVNSGGGSSTGLSAETSKNLSAGVILQPVLPSWAGNFSISADYFSIKINNGVQRLGASNILNLCYGSGGFDPDNGYCRLVTRSADNALTVENNYINVATDQVKGWEFNLRYSHDVGPGVFSFTALVTKFTEQANKLFDDNALEDLNGTVGSPAWTGTFNATYALDNVKLRYGIDWTGGTGKATYTYLALNSDGTKNPELAQVYKDNYYFETPDYFLHSASVQWDLNDQFELTIGMRNIFNTQPPRISADAFNLYGNSPLYSGYDYLGRTFFANFTTNF
ncbi:TonB-dependent receptor [Novosphingobium profundi]|uniref:TonB-dependent receptor plug domain-containing protein n=1 Tax=Novosphingobium profundi TaxID=1774954 RepID=UPI001BDA8157|nr:TonB-dependent receptor [Novosphingobium profundi]MBT0666847.1 TonB-dependent receptor [Novosphingobium profundi]